MLDYLLNINVKITLSKEQEAVMIKIINNENCIEKELINNTNSKQVCSFRKETKR